MTQSSCRRRKNAQEPGGLLAMGVKVDVGSVVQKRLEKELERLKARSGVATPLEVVWIPNADSSLAGEIRGRNIIIYDEDGNKALDTLRHEFLDYCISQAIEPYREFANRLIKMVNEDAYKRKEKVVGALTQLLIEEER